MRSTASKKRGAGGARKGGEAVGGEGVWERTLGALPHTLTRLRAGNATGGTRCGAEISGAPVGRWTRAAGGDESRGGGAAARAARGYACEVVRQLWRETLCLTFRV